MICIQVNLSRKREKSETCSCFHPVQPGHFGTQLAGRITHGDYNESLVVCSGHVGLPVSVCVTGNNEELCPAVFNMFTSSSHITNCHSNFESNALFVSLQQFILVHFITKTCPLRLKHLLKTCSHSSRLVPTSKKTTWRAFGSKPPTFIFHLLIQNIIKSLIIKTCMFSVVHKSHLLSPFTPPPHKRELDTITVTHKGCLTCTQESRLRLY